MAATLPGAGYSVTATYSGDANFVTSVSPSTPFTVTPAATATSLVLSSASVPFGTSPTFTAQVSSAAGGTPTGTVTVETYVQGSAVTLCTFTLPATSCQGTGQALVVQASPYSVLAVYSGDTNFVGSTSPSQNLTIVPSQSTTTVVSLVPSTAVYGDEGAVTFSVAVHASTPGALTGTVTLEAAVGTSSVALCTVTLTASSAGAGSCTTAATTLAASSTPYSVTAVYGGDADFGGSTSAPSLLTITQASSTTGVTVVPSTVVYGDIGAALFSVTVTGQFAGTPTGTVVLTTGTTTLCTATLTGAHGTCSAPSGLQLAPGDFTVVATYSGDGNFTSSTHTDTNGLTVDKAAATTEVSVAPFTVAYGAENLAVFTVTVIPQFTGTVPTGTVTLTVPGSPGATTVCMVTLVAGAGKCSPQPATLSPSPLSVTVTATYSGDTNFVTSTGKTTLTVTHGTAALTVTSGSNPSLPGRPVTFTADASGGSGSAIATGTVTFTDGANTLCRAVPLSGGQAMCTATLPLTPSQTITAIYSGDTNYLDSSGTVVQAVEHGYWMVASDGGIFAFGDAHFYGSEGGKPLNRPIVGMAATPDAKGYWMVASDGGIFAFGDAGFYGSTGNLNLTSPIVGMATTPDGKGYWLVAADGGVFGFGDAHFYGSEAGKPLPAPIVGMVGTTTGHGYFLVAANGAVFVFGDATLESTGGVSGSSPVVGLAATPTAAGYWLATADGGVFPFGDANSYGSMAGKPLNKPIVGIGATADGQGYWLVASDGGIFAFGNAIFDGSTGNLVLNSPMVSLATI